MKLGPLEFHVSRAAHGRNGDSPNPSYREMGMPSPGNIENIPIQEYNGEIRGKMGLRVYDQMRRSSAQVRASLKITKTPVMSASWYMQPASDSDLDKEVAEFVWFALNSMHKPFIDFLREALSFLDFGHYVFEKVFEPGVWRPRPTDDHPKPHYRDVVKWKRFAPRHPAAIEEFVIEGGDLKGIRQYVNGNNVTIPADKLIIFTLDSEADDPTGLSILRSAYPHWYFQQHLYKVDAIQKERHGIGIPEVELPPNYTPDEKDMAEEMAKNLRANEKAFVVHPPGFVIRFLKPEGNMVDVLASARHHGLMILTNVLAQFLALGTEESGSRSVGSTQVGAFQKASRHLADFVRETINSQAIPELVDYNYDVDEYPKLRARRVGEDAEFRALAVSLRNLVEPGIVTQGPSLEAFVRDWADLPTATKEELERSVEERTQKTPEPREGSRTGRPNE